MEVFHREEKPDELERLAEKLHQEYQWTDIYDLAQQFGFDIMNNEAFPRAIDRIDFMDRNSKAVFFTIKNPTPRSETYEKSYLAMRVAGTWLFEMNNFEDYLKKIFVDEQAREAAKPLFVEAFVKYLIK